MDGERGIMNFTAQELNMISDALLERAADYRRMAKSRQMYGPRYADSREAKRQLAREYEAVASRILTELARLRELR